VESELNNLGETVQKVQPEIQRNTDRLDELDARHTTLGKNLDDTSNQVQDNVNEIASLKQVLSNQNNSLGNVEDRVKQNEDQIKHIDDTIDGLHKTVAIFEGRHVETVEKMKEVTVLASNIQLQVKEQEQKMVEQSANDLNQIKDQIQDIENQNGISNQKITELDNGNQALLEKLLGLEKSIGDRMEGLDKTDDSLLSKINGLQTDNAQNFADYRKDLDNKLAEHDKNWQVEHDSIRSETHILTQHLEEVKSLHVTTENRITEMDAGNQQLLEKLLGVEKDLDGKMQGVNENANSLVTKLNSVDEDNKNNSQTIVNIQESIFIQSEQVKKVDAERQNSAVKAKEDFDATVSTNAKAIADLKSEVNDAITKIEITLKQEQTKDNSDLLDKLNHVQDATNSNEGRIDSLEKAGQETTKNLVLEIDSKLRAYDESASQNFRGAEDNIQKNAQDITSQSNLLREHNENINTFISTNATFTNQFIALETKSEDFLKHLQVERLRIDNVESELNNLGETVQKVQPEIQRNTDRLDELDARHTTLGKNLDDTSNQVQDNVNEIASLKQVLSNQNNSLGNVEDRVKQNEDQIKHIDDTIDGLHKTVAIFEGRHVETVEKMKEVTVLASNIQLQVKEQEQKMVEQSANDLNQIKDQIQDIENQNGISNQKITELDNGNQALLEKLLGLEKSIGDRMEGLDKTDDSLLSKINGLQTDNAQNFADYRKDLDNKLAEHDKNWQVEHDSIRSETHILTQHLEEVKSLHVTTENRITEMDAGNQQLLEKLLGVEKDLDGKMQGVNENANSLVTKLNSVDEDNKNNSQTIVNIQESIFIQSEQVKKVDAERQNSAVKAKEDFDATVSTNAKAIADLKSEVNDAITKIEITLKQEQTKDNSDLLDKLNHVQDATNSNEGRIDSLEKAGPETTKNLVLEIDSKLRGYDDSASQKLREAEDNIQKNAQDIASQSNFLREHTENINTFISTNAIFTNQFLSLETKSEDFLKHLQVERLRIDILESELNNLVETVQKIQPECQRNTDRLDELDAHHTSLGKNLVDTSNQVQTVLSVLNDQSAVFESRYFETNNRIKEIDVQTNNIQIQLNEQEKNILEQSAEKFTKLKEQLNDQLETIDSISKANSNEISLLKEFSSVQEEVVHKLDQNMISSVTKNNLAINDLKEELEIALTKLEVTLNKKASEENLMINGKLESLNHSDSSLISQVTSLESKSTQNMESFVQLELMVSSCTSEINSLTEKSNRYSQYMHTIEVLGDKINNLDEMQQRNESKLKVEIIENITTNTEELKSYVESNLEKFAKDQKTEQDSIRIDADALLKQMEAFRAQHRLIDDKFVDINTDQQQISNELNTIQQHYDVRFQSINESAFIQNEDSFITKLNIIEEENRNNVEKIVAMQEVAMIQAEKSKYVESLTSRVNQIDEMRQQSESKAKEDFDNTVSKNAKEIQELKLNLEQTMIQIEHYMKEENTAIKSENSIISKQVQVLRDDASKQNQQLIQFLREKAELESKLEENIRESESLRKKGDSLRDTLANYEDIVDKKINQIQEESKVSSKLLTDIVPKMNSFDKTIISIEDRSREQISEMKIELSNETKTILELLRKEVDGALVINMEKIIEFEKDVQNLRKDNELSFSDHDTKIMTLLSATEEHSSFFEKVTSNISTIESKMTTYDQRQKAITENLLITSEAQLNEIRNKFDSRIAELIKRTDDHSDMFDQTEVKIVHMYDQSNKLEEDMFHTQRDVDELKKQGGNERELVVLKIKEQKETLESFFRSLEQKVESIETTQIKESSRVEIIERQTESQERLAIQLEKKIKTVEKYGEEQHSLIREVEKTAYHKVEEMGTELQEYVNNSREDLQNIRLGHGRQTGSKRSNSKMVGNWFTRNRRALCGCFKATPEPSLHLQNAYRN